MLARLNKYPLAKLMSVSKLKKRKAKTSLDRDVLGREVVLLDH